MVKVDGFTEVHISFKIPESEVEQGPRKVAQHVRTEIANILRNLEK